MKVSVLTPTYRHREFIGRAIESVLAQTYADWELIVVDDGSDDGTAEVARSYSDHRMQVVELPHRGIGGLCDTYNSALMRATGELVAILEGDDWWPADKLEMQVPDFSDPKVVLSYGQYVQSTDGHEVQSAIPGVPEETLSNRPVGSAAFEMLRPNLLTFAWPVTVVMLLSTLRGIGGFQAAPEMGVVDYPTFLRMSLEGEWRFHRQVLGVWRRHTGSETRSRFPEILSGAKVHAMTFARQYQDRIPGDLTTVEGEWRNMQLTRLYSLAVLLADGGRFDESVRALSQAMHFPIGLKSKVMIRAAILAARQRRNPESVLAKFGYRGYREAAKLSNGDPLVTVDTTLSILGP